MRFSGNIKTEKHKTTGKNNYIYKLKRGRGEDMVRRRKELREWCVKEEQKSAHTGKS